MRALITRPRENAGSIARDLAERDIDVLLDPLLEIRPTEHGPVDLTGVQAVLVTSGFGIRELAAATETRDVPVYAVGDATAQTARELGFTRVESARGDGEALARLVLERLDPAAGPLVYAAGRVTAGEFPDQLVAAGFTVRREEMYAARPAAALAPETIEALRAGSVDLALFFSPRTAETFVRLVEEAGLRESCGSVTAVCISANVAEALRSLPWQGIEIAERPEQEAVVAAIDGWIARRQSAEPDPAPAAEPAAEPEPAAPAAAAEPAPSVAPPPAPARRGGLVVAMLLLVLLIGALGAGGYMLWREQTRMNALIAEQRRPLSEDPAFTALAERARANEERVAGDLAAIERRLIGRIAETEQRVSAAADQVARVGEQLEEIERRLAAQPEDAGTASAAVEQAIAVLREENEALAARLGEAEAALRRDTQAIATRLAEAERTMRNENAALAQRLSQTEQASARLAEQVRAESSRVAEALKALEERVAALARVSEQAASENTAALLLAASQIRAALDSGEPFAPAAATLQRVTGDDPVVSQALAGWVDRAEQGIPTVAMLRDRFRAIADEVRPPLQPDTGQGWLDRALDRAVSVVRVRRVGEDVPGEEPDAILARAEAALNRGDLARAVAEIETLPAEAGTAFADWLAAARARLAAREGLAALERAAVERAGAG